MAVTLLKKKNNNATDTNYFTTFLQTVNMTLVIFK